MDSQPDEIDTVKLTAEISELKKQLAKPERDRNKLLDLFVEDAIDKAELRKR